MSEHNFYDAEERESLLDDDEVSPEEQGFMQGYAEAEEINDEKEEEKDTLVSDDKFPDEEFEFKDEDF